MSVGSDDAQVPSSTKNWLKMREAAAILCVSTSALRKTIERKVAQAPEGTRELYFDGIRAKKLGHTWRLALDPSWMVFAEISRVALRTVLCSPRVLRGFTEEILR